MYHRGIQHVRNACVIIHSVCFVCMCLLCERKRLWDFEQWQLHCLIRIISNCERSFLSFVYDCGNLMSWRLCLYDSYQLPIIAFHLLGIDWNMIDLKQFFWGFPTAASDLNDCKTWNVLWIGLLVSERYLCVCSHVVKVCFSVVRYHLDINYNPVWLTGLKAPTN